MAHVVTFLIFCLVLYSWIGAGLFPSLPFFNRLEKISFGDLDSGKNNIVIKYLSKIDRSICAYKTTASSDCLI